MRTHLYSFRSPIASNISRCRTSRNYPLLNRWRKIGGLPPPEWLTVHCCGSAIGKLAVELLDEHDHCASIVRVKQVPPQATNVRPQVQQPELDRTRSVVPVYVADSLLLLLASNPSYWVPQQLVEYSEMAQVHASWIQQQHWFQERGVLVVVVMMQKVVQVRGQLREELTCDALMVLWKLWVVSAWNLISHVLVVLKGVRVRLMTWVLEQLVSCPSAAWEQGQVQTNVCVSDPTIPEPQVAVVKLAPKFPQLLLRAEAWTCPLVPQVQVPAMETLAYLFLGGQHEIEFDPTTHQIPHQHLDRPIEP